LPVQEEEQRGAAEEVDDDERRERPKGMHVVDAREAARPPQRVPGSDVAVEHCRHREPRERKPGEGREDVEPDKDPDGQKDEGPDHESGHEGAQGRPPAQNERARADVAEREQGRCQGEKGSLRTSATADPDLAEDGDDEPESETREEAVPVEADRVRDELADGPIGRREFLWSCGHRWRRYPSASASTSCSWSHVRYP